jgi:hypothetical protein
LISLREAKYVALHVVQAAPERRSGGSGSLLLQAWKWLDTKAFRGKVAGAHSESVVDVSEDIGAEQEAGTYGEDDVIVWMLPTRPPAGRFLTAKYGIWTIADAFEEALGFQELVNREPVTRCDIVVYGDTASDDRVLTTSYAATDDLSLARGINGVRAKSEALLLSTILQTHRRNSLDADRLPGDRADLVARTCPNVWQLCWGLLRLHGRYLITLPTRLFYFDQWQLAYRIGGDRLSQEGLCRLAPSHNGFWADPFVAEQDGRKFIFFEEFLTETNRGHIAAIEIGDDGTPRQAVDVLKSEHHLSYPFVFRYDDSLFMVPECAESGIPGRLGISCCPARWSSRL